VQNVVGIDAVVLIVREFEYFACLGYKHLLTPQNVGLYGHLTPKMGRNIFATHKGHDCAETGQNQSNGSKI